jgi:hypothetical protein
MPTIKSDSFLVGLYRKCTGEKKGKVFSCAVLKEEDM